MLSGIVSAGWVVSEIWVCERCMGLFVGKNLGEKKREVENENEEEEEEEEEGQRRGKRRKGVRERERVIS